MASFVVHYVAGEIFLQLLEKELDFDLTDEQKKKFLLGNLIVDSTRIKKIIPEDLDSTELKKIRKNYRDLAQEEKITTHFRNKDNLDLCIQVPNLSAFIEKYYSLFKNDFSVLGYFFHLFTDKMFFEDLFSSSFIFLDKDCNPTIYEKDVCFVYVKKNNQIYNENDFWDSNSKNGIYYDYTIMNKIILDYYKVKFGENDLINFIPQFINPGIEEVDYENVIDVIKKTSHFIDDSKKQENDNLNVFDKNNIIKFIDNVIHSFAMEYSDLINLVINEKQKSKSKID